MQDCQGYLDCITLLSLQHLILHKLCMDLLSRYEVRGKKEAAFDHKMQWPISTPNMEQRALFGSL